MQPVTDYDAIAAEFYDISAQGSGWVDELVLPAQALAGFDADAGPIIDIGAGTGLSTVALADALPPARIVAVEPSVPMRAVLMARVVARPDLRERITVLPGAFDSELLPPHWGGASARGLLGHLPPAHRASLWHVLAAHLAPGTHAVLDQVAEQLPQPGHLELYRSRASQGEVTYEVVIERDVTDSGQATNTVTCVATHQPSGQVLSRNQQLNPVFPLDQPTLEAELEQAGLAARHLGQLCLVGRR